MKRPSSLRRFGIAAVAGGLLLASGTIPSIAGDVDKSEGTQAARVPNGATPTGIAVSWIRALLTDGTRGLERAVVRTISWTNKIFVPAVTPRPVPVPVGIIVDDGAPF